MGKENTLFPTFFFFSIITLDSQKLENVCTKHSQAIRNNDHFDECTGKIQEAIWMTVSHLADLILLPFSYFSSSFCHIL